jgi:hypothetical protein
MFTGLNHSEETKKRISETMRGHKISEETKKRISKSLMGVKNPRWGKSLSEEAKKKLSLQRRGEKSHKWKGGKTKFEDCIYNSYKHRQWKKAVFQRDEETCQKCGSKKMLSAHHLKSISSFVEKFSMKTLDEVLGCVELWELDNGQTLCKKCHREIEN